MTTIVTKNGSGAPLASDLVQGELAVDLTNKRLYTEDSGGSVIELGTNPSTIDINAGTIDGTVIGGASAAAGTFTTFTSTGIDDNATSTAITIDSSENVGIGTASPNSRLTIAQGFDKIALNATTTQTASKIVFADSTTTDFYSVGCGSEGDDFVIYASSVGAERMRIDSSGNVGIGTASPDVKLHILGQNGGVNPASYSSAINLAIENNAEAALGIIGNNYSSIYFGDATNTIQAGIVYNHSTDVLELRGSGNTTDLLIDSSGTVRIGPETAGQASMELKVSGSSYAEIDALNFGFNYNMPLVLQRQGGNLNFGTASADPITNKSTGCMLTSGVFNCYSNTSTTLNLGRANNGVMVQFWINGANTSGGISTTQGGTPTFFASSDERLKERIVDHESELANIMTLRPKRWDWKKSEQGKGEGFVAQDLEQTAWSDLVAEGEDGYKTVAGLGVVETRLIKALQEAVIRIETLEAEVAALKGA